MGILLIDTSSRKVEFGFADNNELQFEEQLTDGNNADTLVYFITQSFKDKGLSFGDIETIGLSNGPGSFTGLRIGSSIAKGICFSVGSDLVEISSLDVIANKSKVRENVTSLISSNTRTQEFYYCKYSFDNDLPIPETGYLADTLENILSIESEFVTNDNVKESIQENLRGKITDVSGISNIGSLLRLTKRNIYEKRLSDYKLSEPLYIKDFIPVKPVR